MTEFDSGQFVNRIGRQLVMEFEDAGEAGTPGLVGASRELSDVEEAFRMFRLPIGLFLPR